MRDFDPSESMKMREYWMYFPFSILHDWGKRSAEARSAHLSGVALSEGRSVILLFAMHWRPRADNAIS